MINQMGAELGTALRQIRERVDDIETHNQWGWNPYNLEGRGDGKHPTEIGEPSHRGTYAGLKESTMAPRGLERPTDYPYGWPAESKGSHQLTPQDPRSWANTGTPADKEGKASSPGVLSNEAYQTGRFPPRAFEREKIRRLAAYHRPASPSTPTRGRLPFSPSHFPRARTPERRTPASPPRRPAGTQVKFITPQEREDRIKQGMCFYCLEKYFKGHKCKANMTYQVIEEEEEALPSEDSIPALEGHEEKGESSHPPQAIVPQAYFAMSRDLALNSMRVEGTLGELRVTILVDTGVTHNFISHPIAVSAQCKRTPHPPFEVLVGGGSTIPCHETCEGVDIQLQGTTYRVDLLVLNHCGADVILGVHWDSAPQGTMEERAISAKGGYESTLGQRGRPPPGPARATTPQASAGLADALAPDPARAASIGRAVETAGSQTGLIQAVRRDSSSGPGHLGGTLRAQTAGSQTGLVQAVRRDSSSGPGHLGGTLRGITGHGSGVTGVWIHVLIPPCRPGTIPSRASQSADPVRQPSRPCTTVGHSSSSHARAVRRRPPPWFCLKREKRRKGVFAYCGQTLRAVFLETYPEGRRKLSPAAAPQIVLLSPT
ncbi:hypothetical protein EJ110_NYTH36233 [Nymphaea thermarum]|nr:hypothetical protein EJ110_NYTH36233 [Nymphaea thermarum]